MARKASETSDSRDLETFEQVVKLVRKLIDDRVIWVKISYPRVAEFVIEQSAFDSQVEESGLPHETVKKVLDQGLSDMLGAALAEETAIFTGFPQPGHDATAEDVKRKKMIKKQLAVVEKHLVTDHLRERFRAKRDSVRDIFIDCEWSVDRNVAGSHRTDKTSASLSVSLRFMVKKGLGRDHLIPSFILKELFGQESTQAGPTFDLDADDIDYLLSVLRRARAACASSESRGGDE